MIKDYQKREQRMAPFLRQLPWHWILVAFVLFVYGLAQYITDWGAQAPLVSFTIGRSCGF